MILTQCVLTIVILVCLYKVADSKYLSGKELTTRKETVGAFDGYDSVPDLIRKNGYPCEEHVVITEDKYILTLHRIPYGRKKLFWFHKKRTPVFLQHGLLSSSGSWVLNSPTKAAAYIFADAGYDVWMGNARGNMYSKRHLTMTPDEKEFWQFSFDEMGYFDVPASIDYVLAATGYSQLYYIGHSMGTTMFFAGMSRRPEYNKKIKAMYALAPVATVSYIRSEIKHICFLNKELQYLLEAAHEYEFFPQNSLAMKGVGIFCGLLSINKLICENAIFLITGFDNSEMNTTWIPTVMHDLMAGTSIYTVLHYTQEYEAGKFQRFDHGSALNQKKYGQATPPEYDLSKVTAPVTISYGLNDYLADPEDVQYLIKNLPNLKKASAVNYANFNHLDFLWAIDAYTLVYQPILKSMGFF